MNIHSTKFLVFPIDTFLSWIYHIEELKSKLNKAHFEIRSVKPFMSLEVLRMTFFPYVHSVLSYGIILRGIHLIVRVFFKFRKV
jgi:hypothetical protein